MKCLGRRSVWAALTAATLAGSLSACAPVLVGSAAVTAALVATDRRTAGMQVEDERIEQAMAAQVRGLGPDIGRVQATSFNRVLLLTGEVRSAQDKQRVAEQAALVENVRSVVNEVEVVPFISSLTQRTTDTFITSKVKASLLDAKDLQSRVIKVVTEMNVVYLMGIVTPRESQRAAEIARGVNDVRKVVRVFETISEAELARYETQPAPVSESTSTSPVYGGTQ